MLDICGAMVVRKPEYASQQNNQLNYVLGGKTYRGVDRLPWEDLDDLYYKNLLPDPLVLRRKQLRSENRDLSGIVLTKDISLIREVININPDASEVIGVWSPFLERIKGVWACEVQREFMGVDCISLGEWSILLSGIFNATENFEEFIPLLNENGLISGFDKCQEIFAKYLCLSELGIVETLSSTAEIEAVKVYSINLH